MQDRTMQMQMVMQMETQLQRRLLFLLSIFLLRNSISARGVYPRTIEDLSPVAWSESQLLLYSLHSTVALPRHHLGFLVVGASVAKVGCDEMRRGRTGRTKMR